MKLAATLTALTLAAATALPAAADQVDNAERVLNAYGFEQVDASALSAHQRAALAAVDTSSDLTDLQVRAQIASALRS